MDVLFAGNSSALTTQALAYTQAQAQTKIAL